MTHIGDRDDGLSSRKQEPGARFPVRSGGGIPAGRDVTTYRPLNHRELAFGRAERDPRVDPGGRPPAGRGPGAGPSPPATRCTTTSRVITCPTWTRPTPELIPKGIEIRTPPCASIAETLELLATLHERLQDALAGHGLRAVALSHHPVEDHFEGPQGTRPHDRWQWCMQAMLTYGPDINISLPHHLAARIDEADLFAKVNYYAPALAALSLASPFHRGKPWIVWGRSASRCGRTAVASPDSR